MQKEMTVGQGGAITNLSDADLKLALRKRPRVGESVFQAILFACVVLSIFTTIGIVYSLAKDSLASPPGYDTHPPVPSHWLEGEGTIFLSGADHLPLQLGVLPTLVVYSMESVPM